MPDFKLSKEVEKTQLRQQANYQSEILKRLGVLPSDLKGDIPQASQLISNEEGIPKSRAKFHQRE